MNEQKPFWLSPNDICLKIKKHIERRVQMINNPEFTDKLVFSQLNSELKIIETDEEYRACLDMLIENNKKLFLNFNTYIIQNVFFCENRDQALINKYSHGLCEQNVIGMFFDYFEYYKFNSANYWLDYLKIKTEDIIRPKIEKYRNIYYLARSIKRKIT